MTIRLLSTYDSFPPQSIITLDAGLEAALIAAGNASATLTGGTVAYRERAPVMVQPAVQKHGSVALVANRKAIVPLSEGTALTITPTAGTTGTYQRYDAAGAAVGALTTIGATALTVGQFEGDQTVEIKCTTGTMAVKVGDAVLGAAIVAKAPTGAAVALRAPSGALTRAHMDLRPAFVLQPMPGALLNSATPNTINSLVAMAAPAEYYAFRITYRHLGGNGPVTGFSCVGAASDDAGTRDFTDTTNANFKKLVTPKRAGTAYNTIVADGSPGWKAVTWAGAAALNIADPGAGKVAIAVSDLVFEQGVLDAANAFFPFLLRYQNGSASYTYANSLVGQQVGVNAKTDFPGLLLATLTRGGADAIATPSNWADANTPNATVGGPPVTIEFFTAGDVLSVSLAGDSRFAVSAQYSAANQYRSTENYVHNALAAAGRNASVLRHGINGGHHYEYQPYAIADFGIETPPRWAVYLVYSVNDGAATDALMALLKGRAVQYVEQARKRGTRVALLSALPNGLPGVPTISAPNLARLRSLTAFCDSLSDVTLDGLTRYGAADGSWADAAFAQDVSHMTDAGYRDFADWISSSILAFEGPA